MNQQTLQNLNSSEKIEEFKDTVNDIVVSDSVGDAGKVLASLVILFSRNPDFEKANYSLYSIFQKFYISLKFVIIFELSDKEIFDLFSNHLSFIFDHPEHDLDRKIKYKISNINNLEERDEFKNKIRQALLSSKMNLGHGKIMVSGIEQEATVSNWLKDCYTKLGVGTIDALKINQYLINDPNTKNLSADEKTKLKILLNFFEKMKVSSLESPLFEENFVAILPNDEVVLVSNGNPEKIKKEVVKSMESLSAVTSGISNKKDSAETISLVPNSRSNSNSVSQSLSAELEQSLKNYPESSFEHKALKQEISRLKKSELTKAKQLDAKK